MQSIRFSLVLLLLTTFLLSFDMFSGLTQKAEAMCTSSATVLCLVNNRFQLEIDWRDEPGNAYTLTNIAQSGQGQAVVVSDDTGYFWFLNADNVELFVKVLDGTNINNNFWVFAAGLTNVEYILRVTDTETAAVKTYFNPLETFGVPITDTAAFPLQMGARTSQQDSPPFAQPEESVTSRITPTTPKVGSCIADPTTACLQDNRFQVSVAWTDFSANTGAGQTASEIQTNTSAGFWFFNSNNIELVVKILDGGPVNGNFWVFYAGLTNVEYTVTVTDTLSGAISEYRNELDSSSSVGDNGTPELVLTKDDGRDSVSAGDAVTYTIQVSNPKPSLLLNGTVTDLVPASLENPSWTCSASAGSSCAPGPVSGNITDVVTVQSGGSVSYVLTGTVAPTIAGPLVNTASIEAPPSITNSAGSTTQASDTNSLFPVPVELQTFTIE